jgi:hypothetical protein
MNARRLAIAVLVLALLIGGAFRVWHAANPYHDRSDDEVDYVTIALGLSSSRHTYDAGDKGVLTRAPLAPFLFAIANEVSPSSSTPATPVATRDIPAAYWVQAILTLAELLAVFALGVICGMPLAGAVAALVLALYPPFYQGTGVLESEPSGILALTIGVLSVIWALRVDRRRAWVLAGIALGVCALARPELMVFEAAALAAAALVASRSLGRSSRAIAKSLALCVAVAALVIAPWSAYVSVRAGHPAIITTGAAMPLYVGTALPGDQRYNNLERAAGRSAKHVVLLPDSKVLSAALANIGDEITHPFAGIRRAFDNETSMWLHVSNIGLPTTASWKQTFHITLLIVCVALLTLGLVFSRRRATLAILTAPIVATVLLHLVVLGRPRYALPAIALLVVAACLSAGELWARFGAPRVGVRAAS